MISAVSDILLFKKVELIGRKNSRDLIALRRDDVLYFEKCRK